MALNFSELKSNRNSSKEKLEKMTKMSSGNFGSSNDDRFWQPTVDKAGNGYAVIRFLPSPSGEDTPFVRLFTHSFKGPTGSWYIENSLTTLKQNDPVAEYNTSLWNSGLESDKERARKQKRKLVFIANVYIVSDLGNPANEGKVFLFKFGKKIFDKISEAVQPPFDEQGRSPESPDYNPTNSFDPFDFWEGANLKLKIRQVEGYRNYDKSEFASPSPLFEDEKELENVWKKEYGLSEFLSPSNFKSYEELKDKLNRVLGAEVRSNSSKKIIDLDEEDAPSLPVKESPKSFDDDEDSDDDEGLEFFRNLVK
jgi:hypothetical protein